MKVQLNPHRDIPLLQFLWLWKVCSTVALAKRFFPDASLRTACNRIMKIHLAGYIDPISDRCGAKRVWRLTKSGFNIIRNDLPRLRNERYKSEHLTQDILASAILVGEFLEDSPANIDTISQQQLRCYELSEFPQWLPSGLDETIDGFWYIKSVPTPKLIALKIEPASKSQIQYQESLGALSFQEKISDVLWFVRSSWDAGQVQKAEVSYFGTNQNNHSYFVINDFIKDGWDSKAILGKRQGLSISDLMSGNPQASPTQSQVTRHYLHFFNFQKSHHKSEIWKNFSLSDFT
jgi:hypothetical protein